MTYEEEIFENRIIIPVLLKQHGFFKENGSLCYEKSLGSGMVIKAKFFNGVFKGGVYDPETAEEFIQIRLPVIKGQYTAVLKEEYLDFLHETAENCSISIRNVSPQAKRLISMTSERTDIIPDIVSEGTLNKIVFISDAGMHPFAEFRNTPGGSVAAVISENESSLPSGARKDERDGMYILEADGTYSDDELIRLIMLSRKASKKIKAYKRKWIVPANPKYYDIDHAFSRRDTLFWTQTAKIREGDLVYIYYGMPYGELRYECIAVETDIPAEPDPQERFLFRKLMRIRKLKMLEGGKISREVMKKHGVVSVRSARFMPEELYREVIRIYGGEYE